ncbi:MAG: FUN14 domain-containing protein [Candidatus Babeliales bacterium]
MEDTAVVRGGFIERLKERFSADNLAETLHLNKATLITMGIYFVVGLILGILVQKYARFMFAMAMAVIILVILMQFDIIHISINWNTIQDYLGLQSIASSSQPVLDLGAVYWEWIKANVAYVLSLSVGFLIGLRIG